MDHDGESKSDPLADEMGKGQCSLHYIYIPSQGQRPVCASSVRATAA